MRLVLTGAGAVGARVARQLHTLAGLDDLVVTDSNDGRASVLAASLGPPARAADWSEALLESAAVLVIALPAGPHRALAELAIEQGVDVVSTTDDIDETERLVDLDDEARERSRHVVVGAGFSPGLTCLLARHGASDFSAVDELHVAKTGTGGPACARQHHASLAGEAVDWRDGAWVRRRGGSGRELCWFPDPIGGLDCYRGALPDALLLHAAFPGVNRITARVSGSRRDRITARLPMLRRPHVEGAIGAVRVEIRGRRGAVTDARVLGAIDRPAVASGAVAAVATAWCVDGRLAGPGAGGLAEKVADAVPFLHDLADRGVRGAIFAGAAGA